MRRLSVWLAALASALVLATAIPARAEDPPVGDHANRDHVFVTILSLKLRPDVQRLKPGEAVGWINYTDKIARVYFDKEVAKKMTCTTKGSFRINGERLESTDIQAQQFASLCSLASGEYSYKVELRSGLGSTGLGAASTMSGKIVVE